jgi:hypothetical protein
MYATSTHLLPFFIVKAECLKRLTLAFINHYEKIKAQTIAANNSA